MTATSTGADRRLGFFDGVRAFFGGVGFIVGSPSMWGWAMIPVLVATLLFFGAAALAIWGSTELATHLLTSPGDLQSAWTTAGIWLLRVVFYLVGVVVAFLLAVSLAQPISGFALEAIARGQERALLGPNAGNVARWPDQPFVTSTLRSIRVTFTALALSLPVLAALTVVTLVIPPASVVTVPLKFLVTGLTVTYDFLDYPLSLRGIGVRARMAFIRAHLGGVLGFGLAAALVLLVPGALLLVLPFGVAGATRLVVRADGPCGVPVGRATTKVT